jgi:hypothetical protein
MQYKVLAAIAATLILLALARCDGKQSGRLEGQLALSQLETQLSTARAEAKAATQELQRQLDAQANRMTNEHTQAMADLQLHAAADRAESDGLRSKLASLQDRLRKQPADSTGTGFQLSAATKASMVLSELLSSCSAERSELARAYDDSYARGIGVERKYDAIRATLNKAP